MYDDDHCDGDFEKEDDGSYQNIHLLLMLIVGVSQVDFHCDDANYDYENDGSYQHRVTFSLCSYK